MIKSIRKKLIYKVFVWLAILACIFCIYYMVSINSSTIIPYGDTVSYWATGRLLLRGDNPYSAKEVLKIQDEIGELQTSPLNEISMNLYPPWATPFALPLGLFSYSLTRVLWLLFHTIIIIISAKIIWIIYRGSTEKLYIPYLITIVFLPTIILLGVGHNSALLLLGASGFLYFIQKSNNTNMNYFLAGVCAALTTIKPQILYLFLIALTLWIIQNRAWQVLWGGVFAISLLTLVPMAFDPQVISHYLATFSNYNYGTWATPTIGIFLRLFFGIEKGWLQFIPSIIGFGWLLFHWLKHKETWVWLKEMPILIFACVITSAYVWTYDMVPLLIPIIAIMVEMNRIRFNWFVGMYIFIFILVNAVAFYLHTFLFDFWFIWFAPFLLLWYFIGRRFSQKSIHDQRILNLESLTRGN